MKKKELKQLKEAAKLQPINSKEYCKQMLSYHSLAAEYWDNLVGCSFTHDDDECTKKWDKHCKAMDKFYNKLQQL